MLDYERKKKHRLSYSFDYPESFQKEGENNLPECKRCNDTEKILLNTNTFCAQPYDKDKHQEKHEVMDCPNCCDEAYDFDAPF